jgi:Methyltransferase domain
VRNPESNFNGIKATKKYSVDPGVEFKENPVDFGITSDEFFKKLSTNEILSNEIRFHVIFIDGLHLAAQVDRDIQNALDYITKDGFIVLHDCNPPTEWHARESFDYNSSPAEKKWNGTT